MINSSHKFRDLQNTTPFTLILREDIDYKKHLSVTSYLTTCYERSVGSVRDFQNGILVLGILYLGREMKVDLFRSEIRIFLFCILQLHVGAKLVPGNYTLRRPIYLHKQRVYLVLLLKSRTCTLKGCISGKVPVI